MPRLTLSRLCVMQVGVRELQVGVSRLLKRVVAGETLDVASNGHVIARLVPANGKRHDNVVERHDMSIQPECPYCGHDELRTLQSGRSRCLACWQLSGEPTR